MVSLEELHKLRLTITSLSGLDKIERLQNHANESVYKLAYKILEDFFGDETEQDGMGATDSFVFDSTEQNVPSEGFSFK